ncbi:helix-turn-helix domain-containing protein [soil metagenome]
MLDRRSEAGQQRVAALPPRDVLRVLGDNTRYAIYLELARAAHPMVTADIADTLGLHPNTVRPHLDRMREVGLLDVTTDARGEVGRPQHRYSLAFDAPSLGLEPSPTPLLARMVLDLVALFGASPDDAEAVGAREGGHRATEFANWPSALEALLADLDHLGFDPVVAEQPSVEGPTAFDDDPAAVVAFAHCPFSAYVERHPDVVCSLHRGLVSGFLDEMGDARVLEFCAVAHRTPCQVTVGPGGNHAASHRSG